MTFNFDSLVHFRLHCVGNSVLQSTARAKNRWSSSSEETDTFVVTESIPSLWLNHWIEFFSQLSCWMPWRSDKTATWIESWEAISPWQTADRKNRCKGTETSRRGGEGGCPLLCLALWFFRKYISAIQITSCYFEAGLFIFIRRRKRGSTSSSPALLHDTSWRWRRTWREVEKKGRKGRVGFSGLETRLALFRNDVAAFPRRRKRDSASWRTRHASARRAWKGGTEKVASGMERGV